METGAGPVCRGGGKVFERGEYKMICELAAERELRQGADSKPLLRCQYTTSKGFMDKILRI